MTDHRARLEAAKRKGQWQADEFNARYPIGTPVVAYPSVRPEDPVAVSYRKAADAGLRKHSPDPCERLDTMTRTPAWILGHGEPVVSVHGYAGGICLSHIDVQADDEEPAVLDDRAQALAEDGYTTRRPKPTAERGAA